jgi:hypothetical protein
MTTTASPKKRRRWVTWLLALIIFASGGAVGAGLCAIAIVHGVRHALMHPEEAPQRIASRLKHPLGLSPDQSQHIEQIIAAHQQSLMTIRREVQPQIEQQLSELETEIAGTLKPDQQTKWHIMVSKIRENWLPPVPATPATVPSR